VTGALIAAALLLVLLGVIAWLVHRDGSPDEADRRRTAEERMQALERRNVQRVERRDDEERRP
jgi:hypothetical protein